MDILVCVIANVYKLYIVDCSPMYSLYTEQGEIVNIHVCVIDSVHKLYIAQ